ncbi:M1 family aminopeptidase, partial [uncultured Psychrosphaera sp.]|uniref:M1 family aminopeptidase n=1 Tax=uncultured Psychrosphaera sp. TaxID=1403522 RepID=UPI0030FBA84E
LNSVVKRREFGLPELPVALSLEQDITKHDGDFSHQLKWATIETRLTTAENHIAVAPGELISHSKDDNRNVYHYKTKQPIRKIQPVLSGVFMVSERDVDGINVEVYHIEKHTKIAQEHIEAIADTLRYGNQNFGRYPYKQLRLFEVPNVFNQSGYAMPQMMLIDEKLGFVVDRSNNQAFDHLYRRTVHETAHQWWGHGLDSAITEGGSVLVETLAVYTQAQLLIQKYGEAYLHRFLQYENNRYLYGRGQSPETEKPLYRADEKHLIYSKGTIAMNAIQKQLGANKVNEALRLVLKKHGYPNKPATTLDFIHALNTVTNFEHQDFIKQWLQQVVVNDWTIESTHVTTLVNGLYSVDVCISNYATTDNKSQLVELALFSEHPANLFDKPADNRTLLHTKVNVIQPNTCFNFEVLKRPEFIQLDPYYQSIDQQRENNTKRLAVL